MQKSVWTNQLHRIWKPFYLLGLLAIGFLFLYQPVSEAYIAKRYSVQRIVKESSNILFGTVSEVNTDRRTAKVKVEKYLKGKAEFDEIRIRLDVYKGEVDHRDEAMRLMEVDRPIIIFYLREGGRIDSLSHINGKWFQTQTTRQNNKWGWWLFTHTEKYLNRDEVSRRDSTVDFQKELSAMFGTIDENTVRTREVPTSGADTIQLHFLRTDSYKAEYPTISSLKSIGGHSVGYSGTTSRDLPGLGNADILWLGFRTLSRDGKYRLNSNQEARIKAFVKNGGVAIVSGQDSDEGRPCKTGWLPEPLNGVESTQRNDFQPTSAAGDLFNAPHRVRSGQLALDDSWSGWNQNYQVLATTNDGKEIVVAKLKYGKGMYLITNLRNSREAEVSKNRPMLENLVHFAVDFLADGK